MDNANVKRILSTISNAKSEDWKEIIQWFGKADDQDLEDVIYDLPVSDIMAVDEDYIHGKYFVKFADVMKIAYAYEKDIQKKIGLLLDALLSKQAIDDTAKLIFKAHLYKIVGLRQQMKADKANRELSETACILGDGIDVEKRFPAGYRFVQGSETDKAEFTAELQAELTHSQQRLDRTRRASFRECLLLNHEATFQRFLDGKAARFALHKTRLDRIVIDVYHPDLMTFKGDVKLAIKRSSSSRE
ncbi:MAG: hypothetical protein HZB92_06675, partial [Euryarchaeota archaeon]|nr:hypothetical protein [Euryarchaeota archaeon]